MRVSYRWLMDYVDIPWPVEELADRLTMAGVKVEALERLAPPELAGIVVGEVCQIERHPDANHLLVCQVATGSGLHTVVTGATNLRAGDRVPVALPGSVLPGGRRIEAAVFRGVTSEGMLCSEAELMVGDDADGIWVLPQDAPLGKSVLDAVGLDDTVLHLEIYPNRPDCLSVIGIAREVAALAGTRLRLPQVDVTDVDEPVAQATAVEVADTELCPRYTARVMRQVRIGPSPAWLVQRLRVAGMRSINNVVDITNFVMWEWGQPLHAFDYDTLRGGRIIVRRARAGETLVTLDGVERPLDEDMLVIADAERPVGVAGVMGGGNSEVTEGTRAVLLESANFQPVSVRRTARRLGLRTEASHRFEKGLDPNLAAVASLRAAQLIQELAGAQVLAGMIDIYPHPVEPRTVACRPQRIRRLLGTHLSDEEIAAYLEALDLSVQRDGERLLVTVPTFRPDIQQEADLAEEVARLHGYDQVPDALPGGTSQVGGQRHPLPLLDRVRNVLVAMGLMECVTYSFVHPATADRLRWAQDDPRRRFIPLRNPLSEEHAVMRTSLLGGLLEAAARNRSRGVRAVHLFEIGAVYHPKNLPLTELPDERRKIGILMMGPVPQEQWGGRLSEVTFYHLKGAVERLLAELGIAGSFAPGSDPSFHPGRQAILSVGGQPAGILGEVHPVVADAYDLDETRIYAAELDVAALAGALPGATRYRPLPRFPAVERDVALLVPKDVTAGAVTASIRDAAGELLEDLVLFDVYEGPQVAAGHRSLAYALTLRAADRTLTDEEANTVVARIEETLERELGVRLRR
ncbi:MAG: phenylalanine--tRNA ligase subunit beta [Firmicutes bacterium ZCTH02-B6]|nr:MAG: phenylalanine--tRNA ligase subunit beta [Firmicutes bacterium ZCTH02-B6]